MVNDSFLIIIIIITIIIIWICECNKDIIEGMVVFKWYGTDSDSVELGPEYNQCINSITNRIKSDPSSTIPTNFQTSINTCADLFLQDTPAVQDALVTRFSEEAKDRVNRIKLNDPTIYCQDNDTRNGVGGECEGKGGGEPVKSIDAQLIVHQTQSLTSCATCPSTCTTIAQVTSDTTCATCISSCISTNNMIATELQIQSDITSNADVVGSNNEYNYVYRLMRHSDPLVRRLVGHFEQERRAGTPVISKCIGKSSTNDDSCELETTDTGCNNNTDCIYYGDYESSTLKNMRDSIVSTSDTRTTLIQSKMDAIKNKLPQSQQLTIDAATDTNEAIRDQTSTRLDSCDLNETNLSGYIGLKQTLPQCMTGTGICSDTQFTDQSGCTGSQEIWESCPDDQLAKDAIQTRLSSCNTGDTKLTEYRNLKSSLPNTYQSTITNDIIRHRELDTGTSTIPSLYDRITDEDRYVNETIKSRLRFCDSKLSSYNNLNANLPSTIADANGSCRGILRNDTTCMALTTPNECNSQLVGTCSDPQQLTEDTCLSVENCTVSGTGVGPTGVPCIWTPTCRWDNSNHSQVRSAISDRLGVATTSTTTISEQDVKLNHIIPLWKVLLGSAPSCNATLLDVASSTDRACVTANPNKYKRFGDGAENDGMCCPPATSDILPDYCSDTEKAAEPECTPEDELYISGNLKRALLFELNSVPILRDEYNNLQVDSVTYGLLDNAVYGGPGGTVVDDVPGSTACPGDTTAHQNPADLCRTAATKRVENVLLQNQTTTNQALASSNNATEISTAAGGSR